MLRQESAHVDKDGRPIQNHIEELGNIKYTRGFKLLSAWIEQNLDVYKVSCKLQESRWLLTDLIV
jgi:transcription initiation factor TFIID subunit 5